MSGKRLGEMTQVEEILKDRNIILVGGDAFTTKGFTQVPNAILRLTKISPGGKLAHCGLLSYAWNDDCCFPGQDRLAADLAVSRQTVNQYINEL